MFQIYHILLINQYYKIKISNPRWHKSFVKRHCQTASGGYHCALVNDAHSQREDTLGNWKLFEESSGKKFNHGQDASERAHSTLVQSDLVMSRTFEMFPGGVGIGGRTAFRTTASRMSNISRHTERDFDL